MALSSIQKKPLSLVCKIAYLVSPEKRVPHERSSLIFTGQHDMAFLFILKKPDKPLSHDDSARFVSLHGHEPYFKRGFEDLPDQREVGLPSVQPNVIEEIARQNDPSPVRRCQRKEEGGWQKGGTKRPSTFMWTERVLGLLPFRLLPSEGGVVGGKES